MSLNRFIFFKFQKAFTLVELVIAIVIAGIIVSGVVVTSANLSLRSADPMLASQRLHIARSYMEEILAQKFKLPGAACTPAPNRTDAVSDANNTCRTNGRSVGSISNIARSELTEICQYETLADVQVETQFGEIPLGLCGYSVRVTVDPSNDLGPSGQKISNSNAAIVTVFVISADSQTTELSGYATNI